RALMAKEDLPQNGVDLVQEPPKIFRWHHVAKGISRADVGPVVPEISSIVAFEKSSQVSTVGLDRQNVSNPFEDAEFIVVEDVEVRNSGFGNGAQGSTGNPVSLHIKVKILIAWHLLGMEDLSHRHVAHRWKNTDHLDGARKFSKQSFIPKLRHDVVRNAIQTDRELLRFRRAAGKIQLLDFRIGQFKLVHYTVMVAIDFADVVPHARKAPSVYLTVLVVGNLFKQMRLKRYWIAPEPNRVDNGTQYQRAKSSQQNFDFHSGTIKESASGSTLNL